MKSSAENLQADYYAKTAESYDATHNCCETHEHDLALEFIDMVCERRGLKTFLDVGSGSGRSVRFLLERGRNVKGVEPVRALIEQAEKNGIPQGQIAEGSGYSLPFDDNSFDVVLECGVLHHVAEPSQVVTEMARVAKYAIFLSDNNRFGQGRLSSRVLKLALYKLRLWGVMIFIQTKGKMYKSSEMDGIYYSYSVFESLPQLNSWANEIWLIPTSTSSRRKSWFHPLTTSSHVLLCALKTVPTKHPLSQASPKTE